MSKIRIVGLTSLSKEVIAEGVLNVVKGRLMVIKEELHNLKNDLARLEEKYGYSSDIFLQKFQNGELGDEEDFFVWQGSLNLLKGLHEEEQLLREVL